MIDLHTMIKCNHSILYHIERVRFYMKKLSSLLVVMMLADMQVFCDVKNLHLNSYEKIYTTFTA